MNKDSKEYQEARIISETVLAFILYLRFGGETGWKETLSLENAYVLAKTFINKMETELAKIQKK